MYTLGINAAFHDPAACLVADGRVIAAVEEERFTRIKHGKRPIPFSTYELPFHAIDYCLREAGIDLRDVDHVAYSFDPYLLLGRYTGSETISLPLEPSAHPTPAEWTSAWDPLFLSSIVNAPRQLEGGAPFHIRDRFRDVRNGNGLYHYRWHFVEHHAAHAASAFLPSPFEHAAIMTLDGRGERAATTFGRGDSRPGAPLFERLAQVDVPHSLGMLYEHFTDYLGFLHSSDEYKVMALACYGGPAYLDNVRAMVHLTADCHYEIEDSSVDALEARFGPRRQRGQPLEQKHFDLAYALQTVLEETVLHLAWWLHRATGETDLCLSGGVALNVVMNARLRDEGPFERIWVQPAAGDAGTALGAALLVDAIESGRRERLYRMEHAFLGPGYPDDEIEEFLRWSQIPYTRPDSITAAVADLLVENKIVGWFNGRLEFGPRALGARSMLSSPMPTWMKDRINDIKGREDFRPIAPVVLEEAAAEWFVDATPSPFMLFLFDVPDDRVDRIPAARHVDGTARIQTINRDQHPAYYDVVRAFGERTGVPILVNTSFNTRGGPIVNSPRDAVECFWSSPMDALAIGPFLIHKANC
ncbi:MAG TPA: carbamoyltransferase C-terminal domain-containing protein [Anaerolineae bacterium]|nr:carbamoyltransferase C-terminal domain-containing protein [Anaerolineae bacterium]